MKQNSVDIVVGVCTKNCGDTVAGVIKPVDQGLARFFPERRALWQGRFLSLVRETKAMSNEEAEVHIRGQLTAFEEQRMVLSS